jgi:hypothetical protein
MDEDRVRNRIAALIGTARAVTTEEAYGLAIHGAASVIALLYGSTSTQVVAFERAVAEEQKRVEREYYESQRQSVAKVVAGILRSVLAELDEGLVGSLRQRAAAEVLADFVALSRSVLEGAGDQPKNVAAVLAAAAFEDTVRRLGAAHAATTGGEKLADVLTALKNSGILQGSQVGIAQSYLSFRNHALHAEWDKVQREAVQSVLGFVEQLVLKYFQ